MQMRGPSDNSRDHPSAIKIAITIKKNPAGRRRVLHEKRVSPHPDRGVTWQSERGRPNEGVTWQSDHRHPNGDVTG